MEGICRSTLMKINISVIIPVYNAEEYLSECLKSIISQSLREIEIICVNDGSTDRSLSILQYYAEIDNRVQIINQDNHGAGAARNTGMAVAKGKYLAFLDADDLYLPGALETCYKCAEEKNIDILMFGADYFDRDDVLIKTEQVNMIPLGNLDIFSSKDISRFIFQISSCNTWNKLYRKDFIASIKLQYQNIKTANDLYFVYAAIAFAERIAVLEIPLVKHRILYKDNLQTLKKKTPMDFLDALKDLKSTLQEHGFWGDIKQSYLNCALYHCVYNYRSVGIYGRKQFSKMRDEIYELLELHEHPQDYYYNKENYFFLIGKIKKWDKRSAVLVQEVKNILKHFLPPPADSFYREMGHLHQTILELNSGINVQQNGAEYEFANMMEKLNDLTTRQLEILEKLSAFDDELKRISGISNCERE